MKKFFLNLQFIFRPSFWIMNSPYNKLHDTKINALMDKYTFTNIGRYRATLGNIDIWISNYPYAVGIDELSNSSRPSRLTICRMMKKLAEDFTNENI